MTRHLLKRGAERVAIALGAARQARRSAPHTVAILAYHNVIRNGARKRGDASLHLPVDRFRLHIRRLVATHKVIDLRTGVESAAALGPFAAITFDDAYAGATRNALPLLAEMKLPALVFVCPGLLDEPGFWWDRLSGPDGLPPAVQARAFSEFAGRNHAIVHALGPGVAPDRELAPASLDELRAVAYPGLSLASHTWSHPSLTHLGDSELRAELRKPLEWAAENLPDELWSGDHLAFPYGHWDQRVARIALECGYSRLFRVDGGPTSGSDWEGSIPVLPRINVPRGLSADGLELRMAGIFGR